MMNDNHELAIGTMIAPFKKYMPELPDVEIFKKYLDAPH